MTRKYLLIIFSLIILFAVFFIYLYRFAENAPETKTELQESALTPIVVPEISPSAYATDSALLKIESDLGLLKEKLERIDLDESALQPPLLDLKVNVE